MADNMRLQAWHDTLTEEERDVALRVGDMPTAMALGWLAVRLYRIEQQTCAPRKTAKVLAAAGSGGTGAAVAIAIVTALRALGVIS